MHVFVYNVYEMDFEDNKRFVKSFKDKEKAKEFALNANLSQKGMSQDVGYFCKKENSVEE